MCSCACLGLYTLVCVVRDLGLGGRRPVPHPGLRVPEGCPAWSLHAAASGGPGVRQGRQAGAIGGQEGQHLGHVGHGDHGGWPTVPACLEAVSWGCDPSGWVR